MSQLVESSAIKVRGSDRRQWLALAALATTTLTIGVDATVLNVALPTLATQLHATTRQLQWISAAYTLVLGALIIPMASLGDRFGRKRVLLTGLLTFGVGSALCAFAATANLLVAARAVQGLGGAAMVPLSLAMLPVLYENKKERARAMTIWVASGSIGLPLGPIVGGYLLEHFWWGSVFLINVPLALFGVLALTLNLPESRSAFALPADVGGILLSSAGLLAITYGFIQAGQKGWSDPTSVLSLTAGVLLLGILVWWEARREHGLIDVTLFRNRHFVLGTALSTVANFAFFGLLFAVPQYFQDVRGEAPLGSGVRLLPLIAGLIVGTQLASRLLPRWGPRVVISAGFTLAAMALAAAATTKPGTGYAFTAAWISALGAGLGLALPSSLAAAVGALDQERAGSGSGLLQALRQVGGTIGVAILGTVLSTGYRDQVDLGSRSAVTAETIRSGISGGLRVAASAHDASLALSVRSAFVHGMDSTLLVSAALVVAGALLAGFGLSPLHSTHVRSRLRR